MFNACRTFCVTLFVFGAFSAMGFVASAPCESGSTLYHVANRYPYRGKANAFYARSKASHVRGGAYRAPAPYKAGRF